MIFFCFLVGTKVGTVRGAHTGHTTTWVHSVGTVRGAHTGHTTVTKSASWLYYDIFLFLGRH